MSQRKYRQGLRIFIDVQEKGERYMILVMFQEFSECIKYNVIRSFTGTVYNDTWQLCEVELVIWQLKVEIKTGDRWTNYNAIRSFIGTVYNDRSQFCDRVGPLTTNRGN